MRQIEDFMNSLTDMDWGWWPVVSMRPPKDRDIDVRVLAKISPIFGSTMGLLAFLLLVIQRTVTFNITGLFVYVVLGVVAFFILYKFTFAYFWNCRARRLRSVQTQNEPVG
jgi:hypothetical protein